MGKTTFTGIPKTLPKFITGEEVLTILGKAKKHIIFRKTIIICFLLKNFMNKPQIYRKEISQEKLENYMKIILTGLPTATAFLFGQMVLTWNFIFSRWFCNFFNYLFYNNSLLSH